jgi:hypothetical protein
VVTKSSRPAAEVDPRRAGLYRSRVLNVISPSLFFQTWLPFHVKACFLTLAVRWRFKAGAAVTPGQDPDAWPWVSPPEGSVQLALLASRRAVRFLSSIDTCLPRSIVLFHLLEPLGGARLHYGFKRSTSGPVEGHAWVTFRGDAVGETLDLSSFVEVPLSQIGAREEREQGVVAE